MLGTKLSCKHLGIVFVSCMFANSDGNTTAGNLSPASQPQDSAQQVQNSEGIVGNENNGNNIVTCIE